MDFQLIRLAFSSSWTIFPSTAWCNWTLIQCESASPLRLTWVVDLNRPQWSCVWGPVILGHLNSATGRSAGRMAASWPAVPFLTLVVSVQMDAWTHNVAPASPWRERATITTTRDSRTPWHPGELTRKDHQSTFQLPSSKYSQNSVVLCDSTLFMYALNQIKTFDCHLIAYFGTC